MKKALINIGKITAFFIGWSIIVGIPMVLCKHPKFIGNSGSLLRLYWELAPLAMTILITIIFTKVVEKNTNVKIPLCQNTTYSTILGLTAGALWIGLVLLIGFTMDIIHIEKVIEIPNLFIWIVALFLNTIMQELMARGYMFSLLKKEYNLPVAISVTTALFTLLHGGAFEAGFLAVTNVITASVLLSLVTIYSKGLWVPILMHFVWNSVGRMFGIVSLADDYPVIFETTISGNKLISGGSANIEGSIIVLVINCILIMALLIYERFDIKKKYKITM